jgi:hypothetical protein
MQEHAQAKLRHAGVLKICTPGRSDAIETNSSADGAIPRAPIPELFSKKLHSVAPRSFPASCNQSTQLN